MQFAYMTYFLYLVILPAILYAQKDRLAFWTVMVSTAVAHYSVYVIAILLPIESPHYSLAALQPNPLTGGYCTATIDLIERFGRVHGAAFPSAHVAGSMVAILAVVALPAMALLGLPAVFRKHVRRDGVWPLPLRGRRARGNRGRRDGIRQSGTWLMERKGALAG